MCGGIGCPSHLPVESAGICRVLVAIMPPLPDSLSWPGTGSIMSVCCMVVLSKCPLHLSVQSAGINRVLVAIMPPLLVSPSWLTMLVSPFCPGTNVTIMCVEYVMVLGVGPICPGCHSTTSYP